MISTSAFRCRGDVTKLLMYGDLRVTVVVNSGSVTNMFISNLRSSKTKNSTPHFVVRDWQCWCTVAERDRRQGMRKKNCWFSSVSCRLLTLPLALFHTICQGRGDGWGRVNLFCFQKNNSRPKQKTKKYYFVVFTNHFCFFVICIFVFFRKILLPMVLSRRYR